MTSEEVFEQWVVKTKDHFSTFLELWQAACEWQRKETENSIIFHLNEDKDGDFFLTQESFKELFLTENDNQL